MSQPPHEKKHSWYQGCSSEVSNEDIGQCVNAINQQNNVDPLMKRLTKRRRKNVGLFLQNMKPLHFLQWTQNHRKQNYGMLSSPHHGQNGGGGSHPNG